MSNKLYRKKPHKKLNVFHIILLVVLIIAFIINWVDVLRTSLHFNKQLTEMVEGIDYYIEDVTINKKDTDSYYSTDDTAVSTTNYYFYYSYSPSKRMFVDRSAYEKYNVGDQVPAYTLDHITYGYTKESLLSDKEYKNNELKKAIGVILGASIGIYCFWMWIVFGKNTSKEP